MNTVSIADPHLQSLLATAFDQLANATMLTDTAGRIVWINEAFCRLSGYARDELLGRTPAILKSGHQDATFYQQLWQTVLAGEVWHGKLIEARKDGTEFTAEEVITPIRDADGKVTHFAAVQQDISQREAIHQRDYFLSRHDTLTGLPNRQMMHDALKQAFSLASRTNQQLAVMFIDLDGFKAVNDQWGHQIGDDLLVAVAARLRSGIRQSDTIARFGGDEFVVLAPALDSASSGAALARNLVETLASPFVVQGHAFTVTASVGIAVFPQDARDANTLLEQADAAMYTAKQRGMNACLFQDTDGARCEPGAGAILAGPAQGASGAAAVEG